MLLRFNGPMSWARSMRRGDWRGAFLAFALLALAPKLLIPPGMMVGSAGPASSPGIPLVICTGHGPMVAVGQVDPRAPAPRPHPDSPCGFAGHALVAAPPLAAPIAVPYPLPSHVALAMRLDLAPGRGLAAPPPPSQGPPSVSI